MFGRSRNRAAAPTTSLNVVGGQTFPEVTWWKHGSLIHLHCICAILLLSSATNGFDGSMSRSLMLSLDSEGKSLHPAVNGLQTLNYWQDHFHHPSASMLGLLNAIFSVGQVVGLPLVPVLADGIGRKWTILIGSTLIFIGVVIQTTSINIGMSANPLHY